MSSVNRTLLALCLATSVNLSPMLAHAASPAAALPEWPQAHSDLAADPDVHFGTLPNGLRYAIMKNATPAGQVSLRLRIGAGSLEERADQQGLAHFLEHMAFRGSRRFPDQEVKRSLERLGLKFGPDTNAFTGFTETVFLFDLPKNDDASVDTGLSFMREIGDGLTLNAKLFDAERGVVLSEARLRDTPATHMSDAQQEFLFKDQLVSQRMPIGKTSIIEHAPVALVRDYYRTWYRPDNATLIIVGDIDPIAIEAKLRSRFASWSAGTTQPKRPDYGTVLQRGAQARVFTESGAPTVTSLNWMAPFDTSGDSIAREQHDLIEQLALAALNRRLQAAAAAADRSFTSAGLYRANMLHSGKITTLLVQHEPPKWRVALAQADELRRQAVEQGLSQEEVNREIAGFLAEVETAQKGASTRVTPQLANLLVRSVDDDEVFTSPDLDLDLVRQTLVGLGADKVNAALRGVFEGNGPLAFSAGPQDIDGGDATLLTALDQSEHSTLPEAAQTADIAWPYTNFGAPGKVLEQRQSDALDTTLVKFANGVRLNIHPTTFRKDQVLVQVRIGNGRLALSKQKPSLAWAANVGAFIRGGLGKLDFQTAQRALTGKIYSSSFQVGDDALTFGGATRPADLDTQLQVLAAYVTDPGLRPEALAQIQASLLPQLEQINAVPGNLFQVQLASYLHSGDPRWAFPTAADIQGATPEALQALLKPELASGPIEITVVGDTTIDTAIAAVARTFGAIPGHNTATRMKASKSETTFPAHTKTPAILEHRGGADQGLAAVAWPTTDGFADIKSDAARQLLADVLQQRLFETLRLQDGKSYSTPSQSQYSTVFPGYGVIIAYADIPPAKSQLFFDAEHRISAELRAHPVSADELERVRAPAVANSAKSRQTNDYWAYWLSALQSEPRVEGLIAQNLDNLRTVTAADLQKAANTWLRDDTRWEMVVQPAAKPTAASASEQVTK